MLPLALTLFAGCGDDDDKPGPTGGMTEIDFPLAIGNRWTFREINGANSLLPAETVDYTTIVVGLREIDGLTYFAMVDSTHDGGTEADTSYVRQDGNAVYVIPEDIGGDPDPGDPVGAWFLQLFLDTLPWKFVDAGASPGDSWTLVEGTKTFEEDGATLTVSVQMTMERMDDTEVSVPAGSWTAYRAALRQTQSFDFGGIGQFSQHNTQTFYVADDVGLVREKRQGTSTFPDDPPLWEEETVLIDYSLGSP
jgi:hypothetical protein